MAATTQRATQGRARGAGSGAPGARPAQPDPLVTHKTGMPGDVPDGKPTVIPPKVKDESNIRSLNLENEGAATLADQGFRTKQNPSFAEVAAARQATGDTGDPAKEPDYLIEGRVFDCYAPGAGKTIRGVYGVVEEKVIEKAQTQRVVVHLEDWGDDVAGLRKQFKDWPMVNLKEVKAITPDGDIVQIFPID
jgi:hypothetical protein